MNHNHQFTGGYDFLLAGEPPYRQLVCCMVSVLSSALAHTILYSPWVSISSVLLWTKALKNYSIFERSLWIMYFF